MHKHTNKQTYAHTYTRVWVRGSGIYLVTSARLHFLFPWETQAGPEPDAEPPRAKEVEFKKARGFRVWRRGFFEALDCFLLVFYSILPRLNLRLVK